MWSYKPFISIQAKHTKIFSSVMNLISVKVPQQGEWWGLSWEMLPCSYRPNVASLIKTK
jgi:hypothetical protein